MLFLQPGYTRCPLSPQANVGLTALASQPVVPLQISEGAGAVVPNAILTILRLTAG